MVDDLSRPLQEARAVFRVVAARRVRLLNLTCSLDSQVRFSEVEVARSNDQSGSRREGCTYSLCQQALMKGRVAYWATGGGRGGTGPRGYDTVPRRLRTYQLVLHGPRSRALGRAEKRGWSARRWVDRVECMATADGDQPVAQELHRAGRAIRCFCKRRAVDSQGVPPPGWQSHMPSVLWPSSHGSRRRSRFDPARYRTTDAVARNGRSPRGQPLHYSNESSPTP